VNITDNELLDSGAGWAARAQEEETARRVREERLRIAREVHDIVAHSIATINVQAGTAVHVLEKRPDQARAALMAIKEASADAVRELRWAVGTIQGIDTGAKGSSPRLSRLPELASLAQRSGLHVDLQVSGTRSDLSPPIDLAAYRIFQEAITNVIRHASASRVSVSLTYEPDRIELSVEDDGPTHDGAGRFTEGNGIRGMRERVQLIGGSFNAGPSANGGFKVRAQLPYDA
jgi:signal transduction histidine kinase